MLAVIKTGGKQYLVKEGDEIEIEKIEGEPGKKIYFEKVLLLEKNGEVFLGQPYLEGVKVQGEILEQKKGKKIVVLKFKKKKRYRVKKGHRQLLTKVKIKKIEVKK